MGPTSFDSDWVCCQFSSIQSAKFQVRVQILESRLVLTSKRREALGAVAPKVRRERVRADDQCLFESIGFLCEGQRLHYIISCYSIVAW